MSGEKILDIRDLDIISRTTTGAVRAIHDVNIDFYRGEAVAITGESGSGKSVTVCTAMDILAKNAAINHESIEFRYCHDDGTVEKVGILTKDKKWIRRHINDKRITVIFQDPITSLNSTIQIGRQIMEGTIQHYRTPKKEAYWKVVQLLDEVGIENAEKCMKTYPHQFSGGMRQRVAIVIALVCNPDPLIRDEPTTILDVTIQTKIIELIRRVQKERGLSVVYITHDLGVVAKVADYVNVMYAKKIIEKGKSSEIFRDPRHPYTWGLFSTMSDLGTDDDRLYMVPGSPPNLLHEKTGDAFTSKNVYVLAIDNKLDPPMFQVTDNHCMATQLPDPRTPRMGTPIELKREIERVEEEAEQYGDELQCRASSRNERAQAVFSGQQNICGQGDG